MSEAAIDRLTLSSPHRLYSIKQIGGAALVGGPLAAAWMVSSNFKRLGAPRKAVRTWILGIAGLVVLLAMGIALERRLGTSLGRALAAPAALVAWALARRLQGGALSTHESEGGQIERFWKAFVVTFGGLLMTLAAAAVLFAAVSSTVTIDGHKVDLEGYAGKEDAVRTAAVLTELRVLTPKAQIRFTLGHTLKTWIVKFGMKDSAAKDASTIAVFQDLAQELRRRAFYGQPLQLELTGALGTTRTMIAVDREGRLTSR
jgi:multisubunit Na+/H+ antiporter MnhB subunit